MSIFILEKRLNSRQQIEARIFTVLGIIQQLMTTRSQKLLKNSPVNMSEFGLLIHFSHQPTRSWTISELVKVMEMNQPGITKLVASLIDKGALHAEMDQFDKRKRHLTITQQGLQLCGQVMQRLQPDISDCFKDWPDDTLQELLTHNQKLMKWLDNNRL